MANKTAPKKGMMAKMMSERDQLLMQAIVKATTSINGALTTMRRIIWTENWTLVTSVVRRVTKEGVENLSMLEKE